jgi:hypothetical protein
VLVRQYVENSEQLRKIKNSDVRIQSAQSQKYIEFSDAAVTTELSAEVKKGKEVGPPLACVLLKPEGKLTSWTWADARKESCERKVVQFALVDSNFEMRGDFDGSDLNWSGPLGIAVAGEYTLFVDDPFRTSFAHMMRVVIREHPQTKGFLVEVLPEAQTRPQYVVSNKTEFELAIIQANTLFAERGALVLPPFTSVPYGLFNCLSERNVDVYFNVKGKRLKKKYPIDGVKNYPSFEVTGLRKDIGNVNFDYADAFAGVSAMAEETIKFEIFPSSYAVGGQLYLDFSTNGHTSMSGEYKKRLKRIELEGARSVIDALTLKLKKKRRIQKAGELAMASIEEENKKLAEMTAVCGGNCTDLFVFAFFFI